LTKLLREETLENEIGKVKREVPDLGKSEDSDDIDEGKQVAGPTSPVRTPRHHYWTRKRDGNSSDSDNFYPFNRNLNWLNWNWNYYPYGYGRK
jgi:hypothetical protein